MTTIQFCCLFIGALAAIIGQRSAFAADRPNILFCIADDWGCHAGCYGTPWVKTPAFDRVAKDGLLFQRAYTPNAKCAPSRACLLTGRNSWQLKEAANHICYFPPEFKGWPEALHENGWMVGHTQKGWGPGVALTADGVPRQMTGSAFNQQQTKSSPTDSISRNNYAGNFSDFLSQTSSEQPWCFWFGALEPHRGYEFGSGVSKGNKQLTDIDHVPAYWPDTDDVRHDMLDYAFEVEHFDQHVGRMLEELEKRGLLDNTLVIVTSDHGPPFPRGKGNAYEFANHVPLAMMWKNGIRKPGRVIEDFVSFVDVAPTLLDVAGVSFEQSGLQEFAGTSLVELMQSERVGQISPHRDHVLIGKERTDVGRPHDWGYPTRGIINGDWVYVENFEPSRWPAGNPETGYMDCDAGMTKTVILNRHRADSSDAFWDLCFGLRPATELYQLSTDPDCVRNLADEPTYKVQQSALKDRMYARLREQGDPRLDGRGSVFDEYPHATKQNVGFYERFMKGDRVKAGWIDPTDIEKTAIETTPGLHEEREKKRTAP
jgi:arylsulfatase A-like enzyme